jgi:predicted Zn-dependent protease
VTKLFLPPRVGAALIAVAVALAPACKASAQARSLSLIRDAETEHIIRVLATPVWQAAGLSPDAVSIHIVNDPSLNAFVAGGQHIFLHTGLLERVTSPRQLIGVIAHETGHIAGGHLARGEEAIRDAMGTALLSILLGAAAVVAGGGNAGPAVVAGGQHLAERSYLQFSRTQESQADQAAISYLDQVGMSSRGLVEFLKVLGDQEALLISRQDPYVRTHPISRERIDALSTRVNASPNANREASPEQVAMLRRVQAKLIGFLQPLGTTLQRYPESDTSAAARYARAIAYYRIPQLERALPLMDSLISEAPNDPYYLEMKAQMLFENGRAREAIPLLERAVALAPHEPLLRYALGQAQISTEDAALVKPAISNLEVAVRDDPSNASVWYQLAIAYGRDGNLGMAHLASAERAIRVGRYVDARQQAERARQKLPPGSAAGLRADDIIAAAERGIQAQRR